MPSQTSPNESCQLDKFVVQQHPAVLNEVSWSLTPPAAFTPHSAINEWILSPAATLGRSDSRPSLLWGLPVALFCTVVSPDGQLQHGCLHLSSL